MSTALRTHRFIPAIGGHAIVIGAGMAGLAAAAALADSFERVTVLERDVLPSNSSPRPGVPQGQQLHGLLAGGLRAFGTLFPGFDQDLVRAGAARLRFGWDDLIEFPGCGPFPRHELDCDGYALTHPDRRQETRIGLLFPIEGHRWMATVGERYGAVPSADEASFRERVRQLRTPTIHDAIKSARRLGGIHRFALPESCRRHYERLPGFPDGLLPIGDAICRFNPIYGQGMSVAALEACILKDLLRARRGERQPLTGLGPAFIAAVQPVVEAAWSMSAVPDLAHPLARGERPVDLEQQLQSTAALFRLATRSPEVHRLLTEVRHMLKPASALRAPEVQRRLELELAA